MRRMNDSIPFDAMQMLKGFFLPTFTRDVLGDKGIGGCKRKLLGLPRGIHNSHGLGWKGMGWLAFV